VTRAAALIAIVLVAGVAAVVLWPQPGAFRAWLVEVRDGDDEWGWELLDAEARAEYGNDRAVYIADVATADWASLDLGPATEVWSKDGFVRIEAELRSDPATVPVFLLERLGSEPTRIGGRSRVADSVAVACRAAGGCATPRSPTRAVHHRRGHKPSRVAVDRMLEP
jgi:hypothetical protein